MKRMKVLKSWSKHHLPEELWPEILTRLPVKSLLRFRCVSKSWQSLIDDPDFCRLHLNRFKNNCHETHLFAVQGRHMDQYYVAVKCSKTLRTTKRLASLRSNDTLTYTLTSFPTLGHVIHWAVVCLVDGLVMLNNRLTFSRPELMLWNPSIRKAQSIPPSPEIPNGLRTVDIGLGFDSLIKDYKLVRLVQDGSSRLHSIDVYMVRTGLWKRIQFQGKGCSSWQWSKFGCYQQAVCFRGGLYFILWNVNSKVQELISFDLSTEVFALTSLPAYECFGVCHHHHLFDAGHSLAVCHIAGNRGCIWMLERSGVDTESTCWTKLYTFSPSLCDVLLYLKKNGDILLGTRLVKSHNPETGEEKLLLANHRALDLIIVCRYMESLVLLK